MAKKPIDEGGKDGKETHPELSISLEVLLLQPALNFQSHMVKSREQHP